VAREATVREVQADTLVLLFKHLVHANMLSNAPDLLLEAVHEVLGPPSPGGRWQVRCEVSGQGPGGGTRPAPPPPVPSAPRTATPRAEDGWPTTATPGAPEPAAATEDEFDPDDDEVVDEPTARQSSEEQALSLLAQALGAEKIGELDNR